MDYRQHLLNLINKRNEKELAFKVVIDSHNQLWKKNQQLILENKHTKSELEQVKERLIKLEELYKTNINVSNLIIKDNYF